MRLFLLYFSALAWGADLQTKSGQVQIPINSWINPAGVTGLQVQAPGFDKSQYLPAIGYHAWYGSYRAQNSEVNNGFVGWRYSNNSFGVLDMIGAAFHNSHFPDGGHSSGMVCANSLTNSVLLTSGGSGSNEPESPWHTYHWDAIGQSGRDYFTTPRPWSNASTSTSVCVYDSWRDDFIMFPYRDASSNLTGVYRIASQASGSNAWATLSTSGSVPPEGSYAGEMAYDSITHDIYWFAGGGSCTFGTITNGVWKLDRSTNAWSLLSPTVRGGGSAPVTRFWNTFAFSPKDNIFLTAGGAYCPGAAETGLTDTWAFDPVAVEWIPITPTANFTLPQAVSAPFETLTYDADHNAFVMLLAPGTTELPAMWVYCYSGCANVGSASAPTEAATYAPYIGTATAGGQNHEDGTSPGSWSTDSAIATDGANLYLVTNETGSGTDTYTHPYLQKFDGAAWSYISSGSAMDTEASGSTNSEKPSIALVGSTPYVSWGKNGNGLLAKVYVKSYSGSWSGTTVGALNNSNTYSGVSVVRSIGGVATAAVLELNKATNPVSENVYVLTNPGTGSQAIVGGAALNVTSGSRAESIALTDDGSGNPTVCWVEHTNSAAITVSVVPRTYCKNWTGSAWTTLGSTYLNRSTTTWSDGVSVAYMGGVPYVAWTERANGQTQWSGSSGCLSGPNCGSPQLYVSTISGGAWATVGGALNRDTIRGWVTNPNLATDGSTLFLSWEEQIGSKDTTPSATTPPSWGAKNTLYASGWDGSSWSALGGPVNADPINGSVAGNSIVVYGGALTAAFNEVALGAMRKSYVKQYDSTADTWVALGAAVTAPVTSTSIVGGASVVGSQILK